MSDEAKAAENEDLEDGEIEDDDDETEEVVETPLSTVEAISSSPVAKPNNVSPVAAKPPDNKFRDEAEQRNDGGKKKKNDKKHLTEAEKSVMRLHKLERMEREKRDKYRRDQGVIQPPVHPIDAEEDFATSLEKAIAKVLKKDKPPSEDEVKEEEPSTKRGKKRKKKDKHKKSKKGKQDPQQAEEVDETEMMFVRGGSPEPKEHTPTPPQKSDDDSYDSDCSSMHSSEGRNKRKHGKKDFSRNRPDRKFRERNQEKRSKIVPPKRNTGICLYYLQGLCEDDNCPYSHESVQPMKLELCKFYLLECCAKGDKCLYMHQDFPCKFYHTGIPCPFTDKCKFAHGGPLSDGLKQILFKHIETAPKEILGNFPRLSRENANVMILQAQKNLENKYASQNKNNDGKNGQESIPSLFDLNIAAPQEGNVSDNSDSSGKKENKRNRPSRWQDPEPIEKEKINMQFPPPGFGMKSVSGFKDHDMRINSNGDVDMRTLPMGQPTIHTTNIVNPNILAQKPPPIIPSASSLMQGILPNILPSLLHQSSSMPLQNVLNSALLTQNLLSGQGFTVPPPDTSMVDIEKYKMEAGLISTMAIETSKKDIDNRNFDLPLKDVDIRQQFNQPPRLMMSPEDDSRLQIVTEEDEQKTEEAKQTESIFNSLPKTQRDLFKRIQAHQKDNTISDTKSLSDHEDANIDWYSDDEDDNKLTIKDDYEGHDEEPREAEPAPIKPIEVMEKLGDLSKIDISAEVSKLLSTISKQTMQNIPKEEVKKDPRNLLADPRKDHDLRQSDPRSSDLKDPRRGRSSSTEDKPPTLSIYEQGSITEVAKDIDLRTDDYNTQYGSNNKDKDFRKAGRPDIDLRQMGLPFKGMQNYTPASEIDASINSHPAISWKVKIVEIPKPDYTGLKLTASEAQQTGDPRLRKIFRLSIEEKESPASPKASPKASGTNSMATARVDPRRKKIESEPPKIELPPPPSMTYNQQLSMLQSSPFYQTLTSNQKLMLNQELSNRNDQSGQSDPIISAMLQNLGLIPQAPVNVPGQSQQALNILANVNNFQSPPMHQNQMMGPPQNMGQGLLGAGPPGLQNLPPDFQMNFDPRNGILGNVPPPFGNFAPPDNNFGNFNDDFYPDQGSNFNNGNQGNNNNRDNNNRGFRDRPRRGRQNNNNRNNRNFFRRHNNNRNRNNNSPP